MRKLFFLALLLPGYLVAQGQVTKNTSPVIKKTDEIVEFTLTTQTVQKVLLRLDDLIDQKAGLEQNINALHEELTKVESLIQEAKAAGAQTSEELRIERQLIEDEIEKVRAAKVLASKAEAEQRKAADNQAKKK